MWEGGECYTLSVEGGEGSQNDKVHSMLDSC